MFIILQNDGAWLMSVDGGENHVMTIWDWDKEILIAKTKVRRVYSLLMKLCKYPSIENLVLQSFNVPILENFDVEMYFQKVDFYRRIPTQWVVRTLVLLMTNRYS